jgi:predicted protein tyrosine phosphatase
MRTAETLKSKALLAALGLAAETGWRDLTLGAIATAAGLTLDDLFGVATKDDLAAAMDTHFDRAMSAEGVSPDANPRERLFDVIMLRFEAMEPWRKGLISLMRHRETSPRSLVQLPAAKLNSARWALVSAGLDTDAGAPLSVKALGISYVITQAERAWRKETSADFALTMAALDKALRETEDRLDWFRRRGKSKPAAPASETATAE